MSSYEKLCEYLKIKLEYGYTIKNKEVYIKNCNKTGVIALFSKKTDLKVVKVSKQMNFTAEKQIELIKLLIKDFTFNCERNSINSEFVVKCDADISFYATSYDFAEAITSLVLSLIKAGGLDKEEVKKILE